MPRQTDATYFENNYVTSQSLAQLLDEFLEPSDP